MGLACAAYESNLRERPLAEQSGWQKALAMKWPGTILWDAPLAEFTTLHVGGPAAAVAMPASTAELLSLLALLRSYIVPWRVIGRGSNLLVADRGYNGVVIVLDRRFGAIEAAGPTTVRVEAGCGVARLLQWCAAQELSGLEFLAGIPGSVGGALAMNAGAWGREIGSCVDAVELVDAGGTLCRVGRAGLDFAYRHLVLEPGTVIVAGHFALAAGHGPEIEAQMAQYIARRKTKQPRGVANAGSFFKNPPGNAAGRLIEQAGLKGTTVGGAMVSPVHANFLVNTGSATAYEMYTLMRLVQARVEAVFGIRLEPEVHLLGDVAEGGAGGGHA
ncbi:MAG: UDP-N-acetylmuramate dehydrogenase [Thermodesulfobacteriota bacterium]